MDLPDRGDVAIPGVERVAAQRVRLDALLPLVRWGAAMFQVNRPHGRRAGRCDVVVSAYVPDSRFDPTKPIRHGLGGDRNVEWTTAEAGLFDVPDSYPTIHEAVEVFRRAARLLVLHEVDETLRFGGTLPFDPHTKARENYWPPDEANP